MIGRYVCVECKQYVELDTRHGWDGVTLPDTHYKPIAKLVPIARAGKVELCNGNIIGVSEHWHDWEEKFPNRRCVSCRLSQRFDFVSKTWISQETKRMSRWICYPEDVIILNPLSYEPNVVKGEPEPPVSLSKAVRNVCLYIMQTATVDALVLMSIRKKFDQAKVGDWFELTDEEWEAIMPHFKRPIAEVLNPLYVFSAEKHIEAIVLAPTSKPEN